MKRRLVTFDLPVYLDGAFKYFERSEPSDDYPKPQAKDSKFGDIWYREVEVYDRSRMEFQQNGIEVTIKLAIQFDQRIKSGNYIRIDGVLHDIYNVSHPYNGEIRETEITCTEPKIHLEVIG